MTFYWKRNEFKNSLEIKSTLVKVYRDAQKVCSTKILLSLSEKCPNMEFFLVCIFLYSDGIQENKDQKKLRIWTLFTQRLIKWNIPFHKFYVRPTSKNCMFLFKDWLKFFIARWPEKSFNRILAVPGACVNRKWICCVELISYPDFS